MKKFILILSIFAAATAFAGPVQKADALKFAGRALGSDSLEYVDLGSGLHAFNRPGGGWIILSSDDCSVPVLGHSDTGALSAGNLPSNMRAHLDRMTSDIARLSSSGVAPAPAIRAMWSAAPSRVRKASASVYLQTANWNQQGYYNDTVQDKLGTSKNVCTGCVATAMAIVLQYNHWPEKGTGTIESYTSKATRDDYGVNETYTVPATDISSYYYDWDNMPSELSSSSTQAQKDAVADLMFHCGSMVQMTYSSAGSGAYSEDIIPALAKHMSYSASARLVTRCNYSTYDWLEMLKSELDAGRPIIYGGSSEEDGGHQFVLDGYNSDNEAHVNWGWGGDANGWFAVNYLGDDSYVGYVFNYYDNAIISLAPDAEGADEANMELYLAGFYADYGEYGLNLESGTIARNGNFTISAAVYNGDYYNTCNSAIKMALCSRDGSVKEYISSEKTVELEPEYGDSYSLSCKITADIAPGDYIGARYRLADGSWAILGGLNIDWPESKYTYWTVSKISATGISYIYLPEEMTAGQILYFEFVSDGRLVKSAPTWYYDGSQVSSSKLFKELKSGEHTIKAVLKFTDGTSQTLVRKFKVE